MSKSMEDEVAGLIAKAKPAEIRRIARWSIEMMVASDRRAQSKTAGDHFGAASFDRDVQIARNNIWTLVETLQGRPGSCDSIHQGARIVTDELWQRQKAYLDGITGDEVLHIESLLREQSPLVKDTLPRADQDLIKRYIERDLIYRLENPINACLVDIATMELAAREIAHLRSLLSAADLHPAQPRESP